MRSADQKKGFNDTRTWTGPDTTTFKKKMSNFNGINKNPIEHCITTAYWCRDQNFRKYFEMRKKNGIKPSVNTNTYYNKSFATSYPNNHIELSRLLTKEI